MPKNAHPMSYRAEHVQVEQTLSDLSDMVKCVEDRERILKQQEMDDSMNGLKVEAMET